MARTVQKETTHTEQKKESAPADTKAKTDHKSGEELKAEMDALLDEIDEALVENAEEFVKSYIQKGGQAVRWLLDLASGRGFSSPSIRLA